MDAFFVMKPQWRGQLKYVLILVLITAVSVVVIGAAATGPILAFLIPAVILPKVHRIVVFENSLVEKVFPKIARDFIRKVHLSQISYYRCNKSKDIILFDYAGNKLLCVESNMTNFEQFWQWLENHNITQSKENYNGKSYF